METTDKINFRQHFFHEEETYKVSIMRLHRDSTRDQNTQNKSHHFRGPQKFWSQPASVNNPFKWSLTYQNRSSVNLQSKASGFWLKQRFIGQRIMKPRTTGNFHKKRAQMGCVFRMKLAPPARIWGFWLPHRRARATFATGLSETILIKLQLLGRCNHFKSQVTCLLAV